jgi:cobalt-precorrin 5A hydrolase/precorrin-3B C17-methyltransferase
MTPPAVVVLGPSGLAIARRVARALPGARVYGRSGRAEGADESFDGVADHLRRLFAEGTPIVAIAAAGIVVRALAPLLGDKRAEPPVLAVAEDGSSIVPLLGGHRGANRMARAIADALGGHAALTTASEVAFGTALDDPPPGWRVANPDAVKVVTAALLDGRRVRRIVEAGDATWLDGVPFADAAAGPVVRVTDRDVPGGSDELVLHPPVLALGLGCERGAPAEAVDALARHALARAGLSARALACVVSLDLKADEPALIALADRLGVPFRVFTAVELEAETPRLANPSEAVYAEVGCHGVAEAAALRAAGPEGTLLVPKIVDGPATCAIARAPRAIVPEAVGRAPGRVFVVGLGPGDRGAMTADAAHALRAADDVVGYRGYLDLAGPLLGTATLHPFELGEEETRCALALALAATGRAVALVCSGDPGVYAMASLVFELQDRATEPGWRRVSVEVVPGVSAMNTAAARVGAPLGHDFCAVSLSDLLTPWAMIERRLVAAAEGDFVVALYNPVSARRREGLAKARAILLDHRPAATPVVLGRNLGRAGETVRVTTLGALAVDDVDMLTVVIVGARATRAFAAGGTTRVYTPRGYRVGP